MSAGHLRALPMRLATLALALAALSPARAADAVVTHAVLAPDLALRAATAALAACRKEGFQVAVTVVDRFGVTQVVLRDRFAGAHTIPVSADKAWTAASFRIATGALAAETQAGRPMSAIRSVPRVLAVGGGLPIEAGGTVYGAIGVSGAPGGDADERCAKAGIDAVREDIEFR